MWVHSQSLWVWEVHHNNSQDVLETALLTVPWRKGNDSKSWQRASLPWDSRGRNWLILQLHQTLTRYLWEAREEKLYNLINNVTNNKYSKMINRLSSFSRWACSHSSGPITEGCSHLQHMGVAVGRMQLPHYTLPKLLWATKTALVDGERGIKI